MTRSLDLFTTAINDNGWIAGYGVNAAGYTRAFLLGAYLDGDANLEEDDERRGCHRAERAGEDEAGRRDDRAGPAGRDPDAVADRAGLALLADPAHEEDVVVGAEGDEQDEDHEREVEADPGVPEDLLEEERGQAEGAAVGQEDGPDEVEGRDDRAKQDDQDQEDAGREQVVGQYPRVAGGGIDEGEHRDVLVELLLEFLHVSHIVNTLVETAGEARGEVLEHLPAGTQVIVMSDHGFHSFRDAVNLNTWLVNEGFLAIKGQRTEVKGMNQMFLGSGQFWENVDWPRTKAYAMGPKPKRSLLFVFTRRRKPGPSWFL